MKNFNINALLRPNIRQLKPYSSARTEFKGEADILLDANESPYNSPYNRYPDPFQQKLKERIATLKSICLEQIFIGNGSDEIIDLLIRAFCVPSKDKILTFSPSYTMYITSAEINDVEVLELPLTTDYTLPIDEIISTCNDENLKIIFICSPNNPVGNVVTREEVEQVCKSFRGLVVLDEAYADFSSQGSMLDLLSTYPNLAIIQTLSKAYGMAGLRLGLGFGSPELVAILNKIKPPYNVSQSTQDLVLDRLINPEETKRQINEIVLNREILSNFLLSSTLFDRVFPSEANFILVQSDKYMELYNYLCEQGVVVRVRNIPPLLNQGLRFTVGNQHENEALMKHITKFETLTL